MQSFKSHSELVPGPRGSLPKLCALVTAAASMAMATYMFEERVVSWVSMATLLLSFGHLAHGFFLYLEEATYHKNRYRGRSFLACLSDCGLLWSFLSVALSSLLLRFSGTPVPLPHLWTLLWLCTVLHTAFRSLGLMAPCEVELSDICETRRMNVAHGLAWSFYLGYLRLVLPRLEEAIATFCKSHQSSAPWSRGSKRLFILIPINANISHTLDEEDTRIQFYDSLPNSQLDRGGVRGRVYKHSVYRVLDHKGQAHDFVVEYATPLLTLYNMSQDSSAGFGEPQRREQVLLFYRTLRDILERSLECRNKYTLILLNDEHEGDPHYLSKSLLRQLQQQDTEEYPMVSPLQMPLPHPEQNISRHTLPFMAPVQYNGVYAGHRDKVVSPDPTLMISQDHPRSLQGPVEMSDYSKPRRNGYN